MNFQPNPSSRLRGKMLMKSTTVVIEKTTTGIQVCCWKFLTNSRITESGITLYKAQACRTWWYLSCSTFSPNVTLAWKVPDMTHGVWAMYPSVPCTHTCPVSGGSSLRRLNRRDVCWGKYLLKISFAVYTHMNNKLEMYILKNIVFKLDTNLSRTNWPYYSQEFSLKKKVNFI